MARCDLRDKPIRVKWETENNRNTAENDKEEIVGETELNGSVKFNEKVKEKRTLTYLKMEHCKNDSESNVARYWAV